MIRKIITIDESKCNGCGICVDACHEGAIGMVDGKAKLLRDDYCDGLGDCLPTCPTGAISFEEREALPFDKEAVEANMRAAGKTPPAGGCPGSQARAFERDAATLPCGCPGSESRTLEPQTEPVQNAGSAPAQPGVAPTHLAQWPVQIKLAPVNAPYFENANLLIAADCTAYAYGNFHAEFMRNKITLIGCPKLDEGDYSEKLTEILKHNTVRSVSVVRMEVPCCGGIETAVKTALQNSGKMIPWQIVTISTDGRIIDR